VISCGLLVEWVELYIDFDFVLNNVLGSDLKNFVDGLSLILEVIARNEEELGSFG
jgi:hypothetical protein